MSTTIAAAPLITAVERPLFSYRRELVALAAMSTMYFFSFFQRSAVPGTIFNFIQVDLALDGSEATSLMFFFITIYAASQPFVGLAVDRFGGGRLLVGGGALMAVGSLLFPFGQTLFMLYFARAVTGLGASAVYLALAKQTDTLVGHRHFPSLMGPLMCSGYFGAMAGTVPLAWASSEWGWRAPLKVAAAVTVLCVVLAAVAVWRTRHRGQRVEPPPLSRVGDILRNRHSLPLIAVSFINFPIYFAMQAVLGMKFIQDFAGLSPELAAAFPFVMLCVGAGLTFFAGLLLHFTNQRRKPWMVLIALLLLTGTSLLWLGVWFEIGGWIFLLAFALLAGSSALGPASTSTMKEVNHPDCVGLSLAVINTTTYVGVAILTYVIGRILDAFAVDVTTTATAKIYPPRAYLVIFGLFVGLAVVSLVISSFITETRGRMVKPEAMTIG